ncbi:hypothetical protein IMCC14465_14720 [alpha proteobacterium IMCC14465]|uniref:TonB-dependent receptor n=1 Tax=alpha proteobacterium IMCC14465 TaxID=1220535 RepID=J9DIE9_9PROT|nr:hypothetical protein IMCC14465_14720 [alpha proteobacterium IMCC14465]
MQGTHSSKLFFLMSCLIGASIFIAPNTALSNEALTLQPLIVTGKRSASLQQNMPGNISVLPAGDTFIHLVDALTLVPGVMMHRGSGVEHLSSIRSPVLVGGAGAGSFLFMEDGIAFRAAGFANVNALLDAQNEHSARIEVIRGPGPAMYGSNAVHGLVNFISQSPYDETSDIDVRLGSYGRYRISANLASQKPGSQKLGSQRDDDAKAYRLGVTLTGETEAYRAASGFDQQKLKFQSGWKGGGDTDYRLIISANHLEQETAGYASTYRDRQAAKMNTDENAFRNAESLRLALYAETRLSGDRVLRLTPYIRYHDMRFLMHFLASADPEETNRHYSVGVQSAITQKINASKFLSELVYGVDVEATKGELTQIQTRPAQFGFLPGVHYDYTVEAETFAGFMQGEVPLSATSQLTIGLRGEHTAYSYENRTGNGVFGRFFRPTDRDDDFQTWSPKIGWVNKIGAQTVFANLTRGHRAPQTTDLYRLRNGQTPDAIKAEQIDSFEIGMRGIIGQSTLPLSYEVAFYKMQKKHFHFRDSNSENVSNGKTGHEGIELDMQLRPTQNLTLNAQLSYGVHSYEFSHAPNGIVKGADIDTAPRQIGHVTAIWTPNDVSTLTLSWHHIGKYFTDERNSNDYPGHDVVDLTLVREIAEGTFLSLRVFNLMDEKYAKRADYAFGNARYFPGEARHIAMGLKKAF